MQRISTADAAANLFGTGKNGFTDGNQSLGINSTQLNAQFFNGLQEELCNIIEISGGTLSSSVLTQLASALQTGKLISATAGGTANALTASFNPAITVPNDGMLLEVRASAANTTTTPTIAINALAAKTIVKGNNLPLAVGDIIGAGYRLLLAYDASFNAFVLLNPAYGVVSLAHSLLSNGYQALPGGLILQWGVTASLGNNSTGTIAFPVAFPTACFVVVASQSPGAQTAIDNTLQILNKTLASFDYYANDAGGVTGSMVFNWISIGF